MPIKSNEPFNIPDGNAISRAIDDIMNSNYNLTYTLSTPMRASAVRHGETMGYCVGDYQEGGSSSQKQSSITNNNIEQDNSVYSNSTDQCHGLEANRIDTLTKTDPDNDADGLAAPLSEKLSLKLDSNIEKSGPQPNIDEPIATSPRIRRRSSLPQILKTTLSGIGLILTPIHAEKNGPRLYLSCYAIRVPRQKYSSTMTTPCLENDEVPSLLNDNNNHINTITSTKDSLMGLNELLDCRYYKSLIIPFRYQQLKYKRRRHSHNRHQSIIVPDILLYKNSAANCDGLNRRGRKLVFYRLGRSKIPSTRRTVTSFKEAQDSEPSQTATHHDQIMGSVEDEEDWETQSTKKTHRRSVSTAIGVIVPLKHDQTTAPEVVGLPEMESDYQFSKDGSIRFLQMNQISNHSVPSEKINQAVVSLVEYHTSQSKNTENIPAPFIYSAPSTTKPKRRNLRYENRRRGNSHGSHAIAVPAHRHFSSRYHLHQPSEPWDHHDHHRHQCTGDKCRGIGRSKKNRYKRSRRSRCYPGSPDLDTGNLFQENPLSQNKLRETRVNKGRSIGHRGHRPPKPIKPVVGFEYPLNIEEKNSEHISKSVLPEQIHNALFLEELTRFPSDTKFCLRSNRRDRRVSESALYIKKLFEEAPEIDITPNQQRQRPSRVVDDQGWTTLLPSRALKADLQYDGPALRITIPITEDTSPLVNDINTENHEPLKPIVTRNSLIESRDYGKSKNEQIPSPYYAWQNSSESTFKNSKQLHLENKRRGNSHGHHAIAVPAHKHRTKKDDRLQHSEIENLDEPGNDIADITEDCTKQVSLHENSYPSDDLEHVTVDSGFIKTPDILSISGEQIYKPTNHEGSPSTCNIEPVYDNLISFENLSTINTEGCTNQHAIREDSLPIDNLEIVSDDPLSVKNLNSIVIEDEDTDQLAIQEDCHSAKNPEPEVNNSTAIEELNAFNATDGCSDQLILCGDSSSENHLISISEKLALSDDNYSTGNMEPVSDNLISIDGLNSICVFEGHCDQHVLREVNPSTGDFEPASDNQLSSTSTESPNTTNFSEEHIDQDNSHKDNYHTSDLDLVSYTSHSIEESNTVNFAEEHMDQDILHKDNYHTSALDLASDILNSIEDLDTINSPEKLCDSPHEGSPTTNNLEQLHDKLISFDGFDADIAPEEHSDALCSHENIPFTSSPEPLSEKFMSLEGLNIGIAEDEFDQLAIHSDSRPTRYISSPSECLEDGASQITESRFSLSPILEVFGIEIRQDLDSSRFYDNTEPQHSVPSPILCDVKSHEASPKADDELVYLNERDDRSSVSLRARQIVESKSENQNDVGVPHSQLVPETASAVQASHKLTADNLKLVTENLSKENGKVGDIQDHPGADSYSLLTNSQSSYTSESDFDNLSSATFISETGLSHTSNPSPKGYIQTHVGDLISQESRKECWYCNCRTTTMGSPRDMALHLHKRNLRSPTQSELSACTHCLEQHYLSNAVARYNAHQENSASVSRSSTPDMTKRVRSKSDLLVGRPDTPAIGFRNGRSQLRSIPPERVLRSQSMSSYSRNSSTTPKARKHRPPSLKLKSLPVSSSYSNNTSHNNSPVIEKTHHYQYDSQEPFSHTRLSISESVRNFEQQPHTMLHGRERRGSVAHIKDTSSRMEQTPNVTSVRKAASTPRLSPAPRMSRTSSEPSTPRLPPTPRMLYTSNAPSTPRTPSRMSFTLSIPPTPRIPLTPRTPSRMSSTSSAPPTPRIPPCPRTPSRMSSTSSAPSTPRILGMSSTSSAPSTPRTSTTPRTPSTPRISTVSSMPSTPRVSSTPRIPSTPMTPSTPRMASTPTTPRMISTSTIASTAKIVPKSKITTTKITLTAAKVTLSTRSAPLSTVSTPKMVQSPRMMTPTPSAYKNRHSDQRVGKGSSKTSEELGSTPRENKRA